MKKLGSLMLVMCVILLCVGAVHVMYAMKCAESVRILQVTQDGVSVELLSQRCPIVVEPVCTIEQVASTIKTAGILRDEPSKPGFMDTGWYVVKSEFVVLCAPTDCTLNIYHPSSRFVRVGAGNGIVPVAENRDHKFVSIKVYPENVVVLPCNWSFFCDDGFVMSHIDSFVSRIATRISPRHGISQKPSA